MDFCYLRAAAHESEAGSMANDVLRRVGAVLLAVGVIDIGVMIYCIVNGIAYSSSFNIFAVVLGILLMRGSLRAASIARFFGAFFLASFLGLIAAWPVLQPLGLTLAELRRMAMSDIAFYAAFALCGLTLLFWITLELNEDAVVTALQSAGRRVRPLYVPVALGIALVIAGSGAMVFMTGGETGRHAMDLAAARLGPGYRYHVSSLHVSTTGQGTAVSGVVTAWNGSDVRDIPVAWRE
jgi:hypothetical protein